VSSTALSVGTTGQWWVTPSVAMQGTALLGVGYTAVGTTESSADTDYNYGMAPQALLAWRAILGDGVALDVTGRAYFVSRVASINDRGRDIIGRVDAGLTWRVYKRHGVSIKYLGNIRDASYGGVDQSQSRNTIGLFYTYLGKDGLGAVPQAAVSALGARLAQRVVVRHARGVGRLDRPVAPGQRPHLDRVDRRGRRDEKRAEHVVMPGVEVVPEGQHEKRDRNPERDIPHPDPAVVASRYHLGLARKVRRPALQRIDVGDWLGQSRSSLGSHSASSGKTSTSSRPMTCSTMNCIMPL
jgi:hypothetical protein